MDWRSWTVADRASVTFQLLKREFADDKQALKELYELVGDKAAVAAIDREILGQPAQVEVTEMGTRRG